MQYFGQKVKTNPEGRLTRGSGVLEGQLARLRARQANHLIPSRLRQGRILDVGCGSIPYFLAHTSFQEKFAIDQLTPSIAGSDILWHTLNLNIEPHLPFEDGYFNVVTMLAVVEHLNPQSLITLFTEVHRILKPTGMLIITTPAAWSGGILNAMARLNLVSQEEIREHVYLYSLPLLGWYFGRAGFAMEQVHFGYFEFMLNLWAVAER